MADLDPLHAITDPDELFQFALDLLVVCPNEPTIDRIRILADEGETVEEWIKHAVDQRLTEQVADICAD